MLGRQTRHSPGPGAATALPSKAALLLEAASRIAVRLTRSAEWSDHRCTWIISQSDPTNVWSRRSVQVPAGPWLYQGSVGIALFLSELHGRTGDSTLVRCIEAALQHATTTSLEKQSSQLGFHTGRTGIAYALVRHGLTSRRASFVERGLHLLSSLDFTAEHLGTTDVVTGAAGVIPILLAIAEWTGENRPREAALTLGSSIVRAAKRWPTGWSWPSGVATNIRDLTGLAHGACGFGHALVELYAATGCSEFRYAAQQAFAYEDSFFSEVEQNWPDFRNGTLAEMMASDRRRQEFVTQLRCGTAPNLGSPPYVTSWCHGAPGIGLARLRAFEVLADERCRWTGEMAVRTTALASHRMAGFSLCHGQFGNDATLLEGTRVLGDPQWAAQVTQRAEAAAAHFELAGRPWPSGALAGVPDPSLMLGDAGIGYHLLRLADPSVPSILLPTTSRDRWTTGCGQSIGAEPDDSQPGREHIRVFFARTMDIVQRLLDDRSQVPAAENPVLAFAEEVHTLRTSGNPGVAALVNDAATTELTRLDMVMALSDTTDTLLADLARLPSGQVHWKTARLSLSPFARLVTEAHDWDAWLVAPRSTAAPLPADAPIHFLLHRRAATVTTRRLNALSSAVLATIASGATLGQVCNAVRTLVDAAVPEGELERLVLRVITNAYEAGIVAVAPRSTAEA